MLNKMGSILRCFAHKITIKFARCVKQDGFYTSTIVANVKRVFARCVKQDGFYTSVAYKGADNRVC